MAIEIFNPSIISDERAAVQAEMKLRTGNASQSPLRNSTHSPQPEELNALMQQLLDLQCGPAYPELWSKSKLIEAKIRKLGVPTNEIKEQSTAMLSARLGLDLGGLNGTAGAIRSLNRSQGSTQGWLIPQFLPLGKASLIYGDSGAGKTSIALHIANAYLKGIPFADSIYPSKYDGRKVLFIASDGQGDAVDHLTDYAEQSGFMDDEAFGENFKVYAAADDGSSSPFNFSPIHLVNLHNQLAAGEYGLVFIDSLKASCMGSDYSIDDRSAVLPMRMIQAMCAKTKTTLVWLHHTNKSSSESSHRAGGSTDIVEIVSAAHELRHKWDEKTNQSSSEWLVQKLRGSSKRRFAYSFDFETGLVLDIPIVDTSTTSDKILKAIYESPTKRLKRQELTQLIGLEAKTLSNHAGFLKSDGMITQNSKAWQITGKGMKRVKEITSLNTEVMISYPID
jgi:hypothetical protein